MKKGVGIDEGKKLSEWGDDIQWMTPRVFQQLGFLQEVNRRLLHRCGLALAIMVDEDNPDGWFGVMDCRDEGICFERLDEHADQARFESVEQRIVQDEQPMGDNRLTETE